jgi:ankyrin repeat protein
VHWAAYFNEYKALQLLMDDGRVDLSAVTSGGATCLHVAASCDALDCLRLLLASDKGRCLLEGRTNWGETVLHLAAAGGSVRAVERLLENGADARAEDQWGRTPATVAAQQGNQEVLQVFRARGHHPEHGASAFFCGTWFSDIPCVMSLLLVRPVALH